MGRKIKKYQISALHIVALNSQTQYIKGFQKCRKNTEKFVKKNLKKRVAINLELGYSMSLSGQAKES